MRQSATMSRRIVSYSEIVPSARNITDDVPEFPDALVCITRLIVETVPDDEEGNGGDDYDVAHDY